MLYDFSSTFFSVFPPGVFHPGCLCLLRGLPIRSEFILSSADLFSAWQCHAVFSRRNCGNNLSL